MNEAYLEMAKLVVGDRRILINALARRATELANGAKPLIRIMPNEDVGYLDIAMREIGEGRLAVQAEEGN